MATDGRGESSGARLCGKGNEERRWLWGTTRARGVGEWPCDDADLIRRARIPISLSSSSFLSKGKASSSGPNLVCRPSYFFSSFPLHPSASIMAAVASWACTSCLRNIRATTATNAARLSLSSFWSSPRASYSTLSLRLAGSSTRSAPGSTIKSPASFSNLSFKHHIVRMSHSANTALGKPPISPVSCVPLSPSNPQFLI